MQYQTKDIEILVSTMNQVNLDFIFNMFPNHLWKDLSILIINQTEYPSLESSFENIKIINSQEKGLSKSRNLALQNASKELLLIADDDIVFKENFIESIINGFSTIPSDIICFQYETNNKLAKNYPEKIKKNISWLQILNISSCEIVIKNNIQKRTEINFDNNFGVNAPFLMGEEAIFLTDMKKKNIRIGFYPKTILAHNSLTTGIKTPTNSIYYSCGAIFFRIFKKKYLFWIIIKLFFDLKQRKITFKKILDLIQIAQKGKNEYIKSLYNS